MKIYSAYRCNEIPNNRVIKEFEAESVLEIFQKYYNFLEKEYGKEEDLGNRNLTEEFWGADIYGGWEFSFEDESEKFELPKNIEELKEALISHWYSNEVFVDQHRIQLFTDDDEIDLAWYVFDEIYANQHPEQTLMYTTYNKELPVSVWDGASKFSPRAPLTEILPASNGDGDTYMIIVAVYDGEVIGGLESGAHFSGVRLPEFMSYIRQNGEKCETWDSDQIKYLAHVAKNFDHDEEILKFFSDHPLSSLTQNESTETILKKTIEEIVQFKNARHNSKKTNRILSEHIWELQMNCGEFPLNNGNCTDYYDYCIIFDDIWASCYPLLAENILRFGSSDGL